MVQLGKLAELGKLGEFLAEFLTPLSLEGRTSLLVLQASPFCNVDCSYCYLADRTNRSRMPLSRVEAAIRWVYRHKLAAPQLSVVWHAGEPLAVPCKWYEEAFTRAAAATPKGKQLRHCIQTNATLIDDRWCALFLRYGVFVGVSLDGPPFLHDRYRKTRDGRGTHALAMRGVTSLQRWGVPFHAICVVTRDSLDHADAIIEIFHQAGITNLGFNIEEHEGANSSSSLASEMAGKFGQFFARVLALGVRRSIRVREYHSLLGGLLSPGFGTDRYNDQNLPFAIVSVAQTGEMATFSPELLGQLLPNGERFSIGHVERSSLEDILANPLFMEAWQEIKAGVEACWTGCSFSRICRGGAPANKLAELGTFRGTETMFCRLAHQQTIEVGLRYLESELASNRGPTGVCAPRGM